MLDFLFERNEQDEISNIYNYPRGRGATQIIILLAVNCNKFILLDNSFAQNPLKPKRFCYIITNINKYNVYKNERSKNMAYNFKEIEKKWQDKWDKEGTFNAKDDYTMKKWYGPMQTKPEVFNQYVLCSYGIDGI